MLGFSSVADERLILLPKVIVDALLIQIVRGFLNPAEAEEVAVFSDFLK